MSLFPSQASLHIDESDSTCFQATALYASLSCCQCPCLQVITGSHDKTIRMYDIRKPSTISTLTYHKKSVRGLASHPVEYAFTSASADNLKKFSLPNGEFLHNMLQQQRAIVNSIAVNEDDVVVSGADNGSLW